LVDAYGFDSNLHTGSGGNNIAMQLVMGGLKLQPCDPTFVDARDGLLLADQTLYNGANQALIWSGFAKRGLGLNADDGAGHNDNALNVTDSFDVPNFFMRVLASDPDKNTVDFIPRTSFTITFWGAYIPATVAASDLLINGIQASSVVLTTSNEAVFSYAVSPVVAQGTQTLAMASNAVSRLSDTNALQQFDSCFLYDGVAITRTNMIPAGGSVLTPPIAGILFDFNEDFAPGSLNPSDLVLSEGFATSVTIVDADMAAFLVNGITTEGIFPIQIDPELHLAMVQRFDPGFWTDIPNQIDIPGLGNSMPLTRHQLRRVRITE